MKYKDTLINITDTVQASDSMYSLICLKADELTLTLNTDRCYLTGYFLLCLSIEDTLTVRNGYCEAVNLQFLPYFYNVNLNHMVIGMPMYEEMRVRFGYPDFHLFRTRNENYNGILHLSENQYQLMRECFSRAKMHIEANETDPMWSCNTRSDMISMFRIAEGAYSAEAEPEGNEILRYIRDNLSEELNLTMLCQMFHTNRTTLGETVKKLTGMPPSRYILEERLQQSCPDLLFTNISIANVAEKYGFSDVNYYIRAFKKRFGKPPLQYRNEGFEDRVRNENWYRELAEKQKKLTQNGNSDSEENSVSEEEKRQKFFQNNLEIFNETDPSKKLEQALRCFRETPKTWEPERYEYAMVALSTLVYGNCMSREEALPIVRELANVLLNQKADRKFHNWAIRQIFCYEEEDRLIDWEKYVGWYMTYHDLLELRYQYTGNWEEYNRQGQANLFTKLARLFDCGMFVKASDNEEETAQYMKENALFCLRLCDMFRENPDEDMDLFLKLRAEAYQKLAGANFRLGKREEGYEALEKSLDLYIKIITMPPDRELTCSHPMLNLISGCRMNWFEPNEKRDPMNQDSDYININNVFRGREPSWFDPYRDEERFQACYKRFESIKYDKKVL